MKRNKKGFTIVELVIVIAVIAILAAVLIPTFSGLVRRANESADLQAVRNMNTALAASEDTPDHISAVWEILKEAGYDAQNYTPLVSGCSFYWDGEINRVLYCDENDTVLFPAEYKDRTKTAFWEGLKGVTELTADQLTDGAKIALAAGVEVSVDLSQLNQSVNIYLNGSTLKSSALQINSEEAEVTLSGGNLELGKQIELKKGTLILDGVSSNVPIANRGGNLTIDNGEKQTITGNGTLYLGGGTTVINGGAFCQISSGKSIEASGGDLIVNGGSFYATNYCIEVKNNSNVTINDGNFEGQNTSALVQCSAGSVEINGGNFSYAGTGGVPVSCAGGNVTVNGGTFTTQGDCVTASSGDITINGGMFIGANSQSSAFLKSTGGQITVPAGSEASFEMFSATGSSGGILGGNASGDTKLIKIEGGTFKAKNEFAKGSTLSAYQITGGEIFVKIKNTGFADQGTYSSEKDENGYYRFTPNAA